MSGRPRSPRPRPKMPWERDPNDREANYRRPIPFAERIRLGIKGAAVVAAYLWIRSRMDDTTNLGAEVAVAVGCVVALSGAIDFAYAARDKLELIFMKNRAQQMAWQAAFFAAGVVLLGLGAARLP